MFFFFGFSEFGDWEAGYERDRAPELARYKHSFIRKFLFVLLSCSMREMLDPNGKVSKFVLKFVSYLLWYMLSHSWNRNWFFICIKIKQKRERKKEKGCEYVITFSKSNYSAYNTVRVTCIWNQHIYVYYRSLHNIITDIHIWFCIVCEFVLEPHLNIRKTNNVFEITFVKDHELLSFEPIFGWKSRYWSA